MPLSVARNKGMVLRAKECSDYVVDELNNHITIPINGKLNQKTLIRMLVGRQPKGSQSIQFGLHSVQCPKKLV